MDNTTRSTRALFFIIENIKSKAKLDATTPNSIKIKGVEGKYKMESIDSLIPKKSKTVG